MVLIYTPRITARIQYAAGLLLGIIPGLEWRLVDDLDACRKHQGPKIFYGKPPADQDGLVLPSHGFLLERGVHYFLPQLKEQDGLPLLFPAEGKGYDLPFDPFAAAFYLVSRYEEYLPHNKDAHGRFEATESFAYKHHFLHRPVVNHYALLLKKRIGEKYPGYAMAAGRFTFLPTYDIDIAFAYRARTLFRIFFGMLRSVAQLEFGKLWQRLKVLTAMEDDPYDTYSFQLDLHKESGIRAHYFFLCGDYGPYDKNVAFYSRPFNQLVKMLGDYAHIGIHPSYASSQEEGLLKKELPRLESIVNREIPYSRQHYLKLDMPATYQRLLKHNIGFDFTMGYASQAGFRASICTPYPFYDLELEKESPLTIVPFAVMDGTLRDYLRLKPDAALDLAMRLMEEVHEAGGTFSTLWHNDSLCECNGWEGWKDVYARLYRAAADKHAAARRE